LLIVAAIDNPGSNIGSCCIINTSEIVGHDCIVEDAVQLGPEVNIAGSCHTKKGVFYRYRCESGAGITIGAWTVIATGSILLKDILGIFFSFGTLAKVMKNKIQE
jgi:acyl-[acyl carrier protein]--UDP-N-acetylglucosamine O-acyltransferase